MPNWCNNQLTVTGATPELRAYLKDHGFSFEKIKPPAMPARASESSGSMEVSQSQVDAWGTKWDLDQPDQLRVGNELLETGNSFFDTAWSPPIAALEALSTRFPHDSFALTYCELGNHFAGTTTFEGGTAHDVPAEDDKVDEIAYETFGYDGPLAVSEGESEPPAATTN